MRQREVEGVIQRIKEAIDHYGLTAANLFGKKSTKAKATAKRPRAKKIRAPKSVSFPKYHDGDGRTWTGHGKRPSWFVEALAAGKTAEEMLLQSA